MSTRAPSRLVITTNLDANDGVQREFIEIDDKQYHMKWLRELAGQELKEKDRLLPELAQLKGRATTHEDLLQRIYPTLRLIFIEEMPDEFLDTIPMERIDLILSCVIEVYTEQIMAAGLPMPPMPDEP